MEPEELKRNIAIIKESISSFKISISRIPKQAYQDFIKIADEEYCSDYGMALTFLTKYYLGILPTGLEEIQVKQKILEARMDELEAKKEKSTTDKPKKLMNGIEINR
jgi:hypothetical protein